MENFFTRTAPVSRSERLDYILSGTIVGRTNRTKRETEREARARVKRLVGEGRLAWWREGLILDKRDQKWWVWRERVE